MFGASAIVARSAAVVAADMLAQLSRSALEEKYRSTSGAAQQPDCDAQVFTDKRAWD